MGSHLSTIIYRVKTAEDVIMINEMESEGALKFLAGKLVNLVEYMLYWDDYDDSERNKALKLLTSYNMASCKDEGDIEGFLTGLYGEPHLWLRNCVTCGKALSNPTSVERGQGPTCRRKTKRSVTSQDIAEMIKKERVRESIEDREEEA